MRTIEELRVQNEALEKSPEYQRIIPEVMREVYTLFVNERIKALESSPEEDNELNGFGIDLPWEPSPDEIKLRNKTYLISEAKRLLPDNPERATELLGQLGSCCTLWALQKRILKEKYGITWYTPAELNPDIKFD